MAATLLFVHGTGVRADTTADLIREGLANAGRRDIDVIAPAWGDQLGVSLLPEDIAAILPAGARDLGSVGDAEAALWGLLLDDPEFELRMIAIVPPGEQSPAASAPIPGAALPEMVVAQRLAALAVAGSPGGVDAQKVEAAARALARSSTLVDAARRVADPDDADFVRVVARAVAAKSLQPRPSAAGEGPAALYLSEARDQLVVMIERALAPASRGLRNWFTKTATGFGMAFATSLARERRTGLMFGATPRAGDILLYQQRGDEIRGLLLDAIADAPRNGPLVLLGHSLGGIMLFDLLTGGKIDRQIAYFVTVGSQIGFFYKCDALESLRRGSSPPTSVPWLNVYDGNDLLGFVAGPAFGGPKHIEDLEVWSGASFPEAHSAYFHLPGVYSRLAQLCG